MKHLPWKLLGAAALLGLAFDILFFDVHQVGINVFLMQIIVLGVIAILAKTQKVAIKTHTWIAGIYAVLFSLTFAIWTNEISLTMAGIGLFFANSYLFITLFGHHGRFHHPFFLLRDWLKHLLAPAFNRLTILSHLKMPGKSLSTEVTRGILIAIPVLLIFGALFLSSDLVLQHQTNSFFEQLNKWLENGSWIGHASVFFITTTAFLGALAAMFWRQIDRFELPQLTKRFETESVIILGGSTLLFLGFILFQAVYLFGGQAAWDKIDGITYAEYAVQGFNELSIIAGLVILLILTFRYFHTEQVSKWVKGLEVTLIAETLLIIVSAWMRMSLYTDQYGFTDARLFGFWFFVVAAVLLGLLGYHVFKKRAVHTYLLQALMISGAAVLVFSVMTPDALSVRLNLARATEEKPFDTLQLYNVTAEAYAAGKGLENNQRILSGVIIPTPPPQAYCDAFNVRHALGQTLILDEYRLEEMENDIATRNIILGWDQYWLNQAASIKYVVIDEARQNQFVWQWQAWNFSRSQLPVNTTIAPSEALSWELEKQEFCKQFSTPQS